MAAMTAALSAGDTSLSRLATSVIFGTASLPVRIFSISRNVTTTGCSSSPGCTGPPFWIGKSRAAVGSHGKHIRNRAMSHPTFPGHRTRAQETGSGRGFPGRRDPVDCQRRSHIARSWISGRTPAQECTGPGRVTLPGQRWLARKCCIACRTWTAPSCSSRGVAALWAASSRGSSTGRSLAPSTRLC